jgi:hypothetical protein
MIATVRSEAKHWKMTRRRFSEKLVLGNAPVPQVIGSSEKVVRILAPNFGAYHLVGCSPIAGYALALS